MTSPAPNIIPLKQPRPVVWTATQHTNLQRNRAAKFRVNAKVGGWLVRKVLKTKSLASALQQRDALLASARRKRGVSEEAGGLTWLGLIERYRSLIESTPDEHLRESSKAYKLELLDALTGTPERTVTREVDELAPRQTRWDDPRAAKITYRLYRTGRKVSRSYTVKGIECPMPELLAGTIGKFTVVHFAELASKLRGRYSATRYNAMLDTIRALLKPAVEMGVFEKNPIEQGLDSEKIRRASVVVKAKRIPAPKELAALFNELKPRGVRYQAGSRQSKMYFFARFLCYFPHRPGTAERLTVEMVNRKAARFEIPGEIIKKGVPGTIYYPPIMPKMATVLDELDREFGKEREMVLPFKVSRKVLADACQKLGMPKITYHWGRHIVTSYALMTPVDVATVALWRGDKDGGAMLLRTYAHIIDKHSAKMAKKVSY